MIKIFLQVIDFLKNEFKSLQQSLIDSYKKAPADLQKGVRRTLLSALIIVLIYIFWGWGSDLIESRHLREEQLKGPIVKVVKSKKAAAEKTVTLLGEARPYAAVTLYARVSGFVKEVRVDKGDIVKKGQTLALIESPEAESSYRAVSTDAKNKKAIAERMETLFQKELVSRQERDTAQSDAEVAAAQAASQGVLKSYQVLKAPFDGVVVARYADPGALVQNASASATSSLPVLALSQANKLRIYVYLDQRDAHFVSTETLAKISLSERPEVKILGRVARVSGQLDDKTKMLLTEIDVENDKSIIIPGSLVQVALDIAAVPGIVVPSEAIVLRDGKTTVPVVNAENRIQYNEVRVVDNDGKMAKLQSGIEEGQTVALNLGNRVNNNDLVRPVPVEEPPKPAEEPKEKSPPKVESTPPSTEKREAQ